VITTMSGVVRAFLEEFTYKPDTRIEMHPEHYGVQIVAIRKLPDSRDGEHPEIRVMGSIAVDKHLMRADDPKAALQDQVHRWLIDMEIHECNEWFRVAGELPYDPHRGR
jgi:hypothetical protein